MTSSSSSPDEESSPMSKDSIFPDMLTDLPFCITLYSDNEVVIPLSSPSLHCFRGFHMNIFPLPGACGSKSSHSGQQLTSTREKTYIHQRWPATNCVITFDQNLFIAAYLRESSSSSTQRYDSNKNKHVHAYDRNSDWFTTD